MQKNRYILLLIVVICKTVYSQSISDTNLVTAKPLYVDSIFTKTIDTVGNVKVIQYFHPSKTYKGRKMFLGKDKYLLSGELIESRRIDYEKEITMGYTFYETGELSGINICRLNGECDLIYFHENGKIKSMFSMSSDELYTGLWLTFDSDGKLIEKRFYGEDGIPIDE